MDPNAVWPPSAALLVLPLLAWALSRLVRRLTGCDSEGRAVWLFGLAATVFLWPAVVLPGGVPSPAASLGEHWPWRAEIDGGTESIHGNPGMADVTYQIQPWLLLLRAQVRAGEAPFWNPHQLLGQPFWANGQSAPLFPLHLLFVALPVRWGFLLLPWLRILIAALGTRRFARRLGVGETGALVAGLAFPLSGMMSGFLLYPMGNALCMVPWVLWAVEGLMPGEGDQSPGSARRGTRRLALAVGLLALAGHPGTLAHTALLTGVWCLARCLPVRSAGRRSVARRFGRVGVAWLLGGALAAVHLLPVALHLRETTRWQPPTVGSDDAGPDATVVLPLLLRWTIPKAFGAAEDGTWFGPFFDLSSRVFPGAAVLCLALFVLFAVPWWRDARWRAVVLCLASAGAIAYGVPFVRDVVEALPGLGRGLHHRLVFAVDLALALLAGLGLERLSQVDRAALRRGLVAAGLLLAAAWATGFALLADDWTARGLFGTQVGWLVASVAVGASVAWAARVSRAGRRRLVGIVPWIVLVELTVAHAGALPGRHVHQLYPTTPAIEFLKEQGGVFAAAGQTLRPNAAIVYGLRDLRGDDPARLRRFDRVFQHLAPVPDAFFHPIESWDGDWLDLFQVRWIVTAPGESSPDPGWRAAYLGVDADIYERPLPLREQHVEVERRSNRTLRVTFDGPGRAVLAETWAPGWTARVVDEAGSARLETERDVLMAVVVSSSDANHTQTVVELSYRPPGLWLGLALSLGAVLLLVGSVWVDREAERS